MPVRLKDIMAAEQRLDEALAAQKRAANHDTWSGAREAIDAAGTKTLVLTEGHMRRQDANLEAVVKADRELRALQRAFATGTELGPVLPAVNFGGR